MKFVQKISLILPLTLALTQGFAQDLKTSTAKESYSLGASTGNYIGNQIYNQIQLGAKVDVDLVVKGFSDALKQKLQLKEEEIITSLNNRAKFLNEAKKKQIKQLQETNLKKEKEFLAKNAKNPDIKTTKSGLQYQIIKKTDGKKVKAESIVVMDYKASLIDGYVFDDTKARKAPAHLSMVNIVDGLKEGLLLMNEGAHYKLYIPSKLGYKDVQMRDIPPNSTLIFDVELKKVLKPSDMRTTKKFEMSEYKKEKK